MNKVQTKLIIFAFFLAIGLGIGSFYFSYSNLQSVEQLFNSRQEEKETLFDSLTKLKSSSLLAYAYDYTYWDDMVNLVEKGDDKFAKENIDPSLSTYKANAAWVYRLDFSGVYAVNDLEDEDLKTFPLPTASLKKIFVGSLFPHFYVLTPKGVMEIAGAPIQPSTDVERKSSPRGYFLVGRLWDKAYLDELSTFMAGEVERDATDDTKHEFVSDLKQGIVIFRRELTGFDGKSVDRIHVEVKTPITTVLNKTSTNQFAFQIIGPLSAAILMMAVLFLWVIRPLGLVSKSLEKGDSKFIERLRNSKSEFGQIANMIAKFLEQKTSLEKEVSEHFRAQKELEKQKDELERINKTMIDRELRMVGLKKEIENYKDQLSQKEKKT